MNIKGSFCARALGVSLHLSLFLFLTAPALVEQARTVVLVPMILLSVFIVLEASLRLGGNIRRIGSFLSDRLSGCRVLAALAAGYVLCDLLNLTYSPIQQEILRQYPTVAGGLLLWLGILFYVDCADKLDNLLMNVAFSGLVLAIPAVSGVSFPDARSVWRVILAGLMTGAVFFLSAQYNRRFKATVVTMLGAVMVPSMVRLTGWTQPTAVALIYMGDRKGVFSSAVEQLQKFSVPEVLFGRGSGYDRAALGQPFGAGNFMLADLLSGGVVRFAISLTLWLCIAYCIIMLFLYQKGIPFIYLLILGLILVEGFTAFQTGYLFDPLFFLFCSLLVAEHTLQKKGRARRQE